MNRVFRSARGKAGADSKNQSQSSSTSHGNSEAMTGSARSISSINRSRNNAVEEAATVRISSRGKQEQIQRLNGFMAAQPPSMAFSAGTANVALSGSSLKLDQGPPAAAVRPTASFAAKAAASATMRDGMVPSQANNHILQTNVQVCARIRPLTADTSAAENDSFFIATPRRRKLGLSASKIKKPGFGSNGADASSKGSRETFLAWDVSDDARTVSQSNKTDKIQGRTHSYTLDKIFGTNSSTQHIYDQSVAPLVQSAMEGYHSTVLAYGQTSTGKTHTMTGTRDDPGLIPRCMKDCFRYVEDNNCKEPREYLFRLSYLEVYKEHIRDLLSGAMPPEPVRLFDGPQGLLIRGLKEEVVTSPEQVFHLLTQGEKRRQVGATHMNEHSSRSHVMVRLWIESSNPNVGATSAVTGKPHHETRVSSLSLVDLAGSESVRLNGAGRREEGQYINKSLMTLGQVVLSLSDASESGTKKSLQHIPYRDSKLTRLLQPSLSGNAQMLLLCCISPMSSHLEESHNTFKFASRAKRIEQEATIQTIVNDEETLLQTYRDEIEDLKQQLADAKEQHERLMEAQQSLPLQLQTSVGTVLTTAAATTMTTPSVGAVETATEEVQELVKAIETMERLILKSRPKIDQDTTAGSGLAEVCVSTNAVNDTLTSLLENDSDDEDGDEELLVDDAAIPTTLLTPSSRYDNMPAVSSTHSVSTEDQLHSELARIRGLLGSVLQKRGVVPVLVQPAAKSLNFSTPPRTPDRSLSDELEAMNISDDDNNRVETEHEEKKAEVETLKKQLEKSERTTNLRKADSSFLQAQLREKDQLLEEVSNLLEAVEQRQVELEKENAFLKSELEIMKRTAT